MAKKEKTLPEMLADLDEYVTEAGAIVQAAKDYVSLRERVTAMPNTRKDHNTKLELAYTNLRELVN